MIAAGLKAKAGPEAMQEHAVILFDGVCNLCTWSVQFIIKHDPKGYFKVGALQSEAGRKVAKRHGIPVEPKSSIVLIEGSRCFTKSDAALRIAAHLSGLWPLLRILSIIPRPMRDWCYDVVAKNRYRWFGKKNTCMAPSRENVSRFIQYE